MFKRNEFEKHYIRGQEYLKNHEYIKAKDEYLECLSLEPDDIGVLNNLAQLCSIIGDYGKANGYNEILLKECDKQLKYGKTEQLLILKSNALISLKRNDEANEVITELLEENPDNVLGLFHKAQYHELNKNYPEALRYINKVLNQNSTNIPALLSKGRILVELEDFKRAENCYDIVFKLETKNKAAINLKSELIKRMNNLTITPHDFMLKAVEAWDEEDFKSSQDYFKKALEIDPNYDEIWFAQGELFIRTGQLSKAISSFNRAFELNPNSGGISKKKSFYKMLNIMKKVNTVLGLEKK